MIVKEVKLLFNFKKEYPDTRKVVSIIGGIVQLDDGRRVPVADRRVIDKIKIEGIELKIVDVPEASLDQSGGRISCKVELENGEFRTIEWDGEKLEFLLTEV